MAACEVDGKRAHDALEVDAVMLIESDVLGCDGALEDVSAHLVDFDRLALFEVQLRQNGARAARFVVIVRIDGGFLSEVVRVGIAHVGKVLAPFVDERHSALVATE